ncbi:MAG: c-type cytochrome [Ferruginibacter sp.]
MKKSFLFIAAMIIVTTVSLIACSNEKAEEKSTIVKTDSAAQVKKGEYLVSIVGCDDCHSPKRMGEHGPEIIPELRLSGYPSTRPIQKADSNVIKQGWVLMGPDLTSAVGPWGVSFAANLTSDVTGIGNWKEENFIKSIREGKLKGLDGSRPLLPPMPWFVYKNMTDDDLKAIFAYLKTVKPVDNVVPRPVQLADIK